MTIYQSTDASAPTLSGTSGDLINLLDKCLVSGYGSKAAAGWTKPYTGTNRASFRQGAGCQFYLDVLDDGSLTAAAREAQFSGFEVMTASATGTGEFPTAAQQATRLKHRKSDTADTVQRPWVLLADNKTFILVTIPFAAATYYAMSYFGDFFSFRAGDAYNCIAIGRTTSATLDSAANENIYTLQATSANLNTPTPGHYCARGYTGLGTSVQLGKLALIFTNASTTSTLPGQSGLAFPNPEDIGMYLCRLYLLDSSTLPATNARGYLRGLWNPQHVVTNIPQEIEYAGQGSLAGRTFKPQGLTGRGAYLIETSDTWD